MKRNSIDIITLGCSKNLVDSERLMRQFELNGYTVRHDPQNVSSEIVVVNTCGFIADAKEESINMILELCEAKQEGRIGQLYVMGCLSQRYFEELGKEIPEVDKFYGKFNWTELISDIGKTYYDNCGQERHLTTPKHYAYVKIAEGCDRQCAYCSIPIITGTHKSRRMEEIVEEVEQLVSKGVKEFQIIAQEITFYGIDLYGKQCIAELVRRISDVKGVEWIRLHYAYPTHFPYELLEVMRERKNVCKYLDIALQHINDKVLENMQRHITKQETLELIDRIRKEVPGICLRTTLMVGFPGEGEAEFEELKDFVRKARFERMGAFAYSEEDGTPAAEKFEDEVSEEEKERRLSELMALQQGISAEVQAEKVGTVQKVIIDRREGDYYVGRTQYDSPEVDPEVLIPVAEGTLRRGCFYDVQITDSDDFDLYGKKL
ncbi:MAG: 30S ribosomal protein S12 methylthiotransferase RimO [Bacteroidaceae bacterium]|nr:30S ribosomal protein S12 methylthiotransferase RimO [Bacteroidaceae bacterium]